jgi:hypothetical protein
MSDILGQAARNPLRPAHPGEDPRLEAALAELPHQVGTGPGDVAPVSPATPPGEVATGGAESTQPRTLTDAEQRGLDALRGTWLLSTIGRVARMSDSIRRAPQSVRETTAAVVESAQAGMQSAGEYGSAVRESASTAVSAAAPAAKAGVRGLVHAMRESSRNNRARKQNNKATFADLDRRALQERIDAHQAAAVEVAGRDESRGGAWGAAFLAARAHRAATKSAVAASKRDRHAAAAAHHRAAKRGHVEQVVEAADAVARPLRSARN